MEWPSIPLWEHSAGALAAPLHPSSSFRVSHGGHGAGNAGQGNAGQGNAGQGNAGQGNAGQGNAGQGNAGQGNAGQGNAGQGKPGAGDPEGSGVSPAPNGLHRLHHDLLCACFLLSPCRAVSVAGGVVLRAGAAQPLVAGASVAHHHGQGHVARGVAPGAQPHARGPLPAPARPCSGCPSTASGTCSGQPPWPWPTPSSRGAACCAAPRAPTTRWVAPGRASFGEQHWPPCTDNGRSQGA